MSKPYYEKTFDRHKKDLEDVTSGERHIYDLIKGLGLLI